MKLLRKSIAGTLESGDIMITLEPSSDEVIRVQLESPVMRLYGRQIEDIIKNTLTSLGVTSCLVEARDKGAVDFTIKGRVQTAVFRALGDEAKVNWGEFLE